MSRNSAPARAALVAGLVALVAGCSDGSLATVSGTVTLDGAPLDRGSVTFLPIGPGSGATASIQSDGTYQVRSGSVAGLPPGDYKITVRANADPTPNPGGGPPAPGRLITPEKYGSSDTSGLQRTIEAGANTVDLELTSS